MRFLLTVYFPGVLLSLCSLLYLGLHGDWIWLLATLGFWCLLSGLGIAVGFHRIYSHHCFTNLEPWLDSLILWCGTMAGQGSSLSWVAVHVGYHHRYSDTPRDPHTPKYRGFGHAVCGWYEGIDETSINHKYAARLLRNPRHVWVHKHYTRVLYGAVAVIAALSWLLIGDLKLFFYGYGIAWGIAIMQDNLVNYFGHTPKFGYQNFDYEDRKDQSCNFWPLGYLGWGQGWHENHHVYPERFSFKHHWWEFDPCVLWKPFLRLGAKERK